MNEKINKLALGTKLTATDAVAQLSEATGFDDQKLLDKMPLLKEHKGTVTLSDISARNQTRLLVVLGEANTSYQIYFADPDGEPEIMPWEHDDLSGLKT